MTASRDDIEAETDSEADAESAFRRAYRRLADGVNWFREFNRGFSNNSHFLDRKD